MIDRTLALRAAAIAEKYAAEIRGRAKAVVRYKPQDVIILESQAKEYEAVAGELRRSAGA